MKDSQLIIDINNMNDIKKIKDNKNIKYINIDIEKPNLEVIYYLLENGKNYSYSEKTGDNKGYIYVSYDIFKTAQLFILEIINHIPITLNETEISRYLYITIGKNIGYDININPEKNETFSLKDISIINNLWGSIYYRKGTNLSLTKIYLYLCNIMNIDCQIITTNKIGYQKNLLTIQNRNIIVDITKDIPYIQAGFKTKNFLGYNDNKELDKKIGYINDIYNESNIEQTLRNIDYNDEKVVLTILNKISNSINMINIRPIELSIILENIFEKYCPNKEIKIHNLYMNNNNQKEHFILINYNNIYYSFNYRINRFIEINEKEIIKSIEENKIGIYLNESIPFITTNPQKVLS